MAAVAVVVVVAVLVVLVVLEVVVLGPPAGAGTMGTGRRHSHQS